MAKIRGNPVSDQQIITCYAQDHSIHKVAVALGIGTSTVHRALTKHGIPRDGLEEWRLGVTKFRGAEADILKAYESGMTMSELGDIFGPASTYAFKHAIRRAGGRLRASPAALVRNGELERIKELHASGMGQMPISLAIGRSQSFVSSVMRRNGISSHHYVGERHGRWNGGRTKAGEYWRIKVSPEDPMSSMANQSGYVLEHRLVMARHLGRVLLPTETVHHINGDGMDNPIENLELRQGKHGKHVVMCCQDCGSRNIGPVPLSSVAES